jgi:hypothetical protein
MSQAAGRMAIIAVGAISKGRSLVTDDSVW